MPATVEQLSAKARGTVDALTKMTAKEREHHPTMTFANDYNNFRRLALEARPDLADIASPEVKGMDAFNEMPDCRFVELQAYYQQFVELLKKYV
jgi:hypothetical protein